jgi:hypothetical protein
MKRFTFWIPIEGSGDNAQEAWDEAMEKLLAAALTGEYTKPPEDVFGEHEEVPAAEILGGSLSNGFGIDNGEEE